MRSIDKKIIHFEKQGKTVVLVAVDGQLERKSFTIKYFTGSIMYMLGCLLGAFVIADTIKPMAAEAMSRLQTMGMEVVLLTGDNRRTANAIASEVGIDHDNVFAEVLPSQKQNKINELKESCGHKNHKVVLHDCCKINPPSLFHCSQLAVDYYEVTKMHFNVSR